MKYIVSYQKPNNHYIDIEFIIKNVDSKKLEIQLPAWRPGRYELGNFAKNIQKQLEIFKRTFVMSQRMISKCCNCVLNNNYHSKKNGAVAFENKMLH